MQPLPLLPRFHDASGIHRSPTVALAVVGFLRHLCNVHTADVFPMTLASPAVAHREPVDWEEEGTRFVDFLRIAQFGLSPVFG